MPLHSSQRDAIHLELAVEVLRSSGDLRFRANGASMLPSIFPGDILLVQSQPMAKARCGDVALWSRDGRFYAHRVTRLLQDGHSTAVVTRGDALTAEDPPVGRDEYLGAVLAVVRRGRLIELSAKPTFAKRLLSYFIRRSDGFVLWLLRGYAFRLRLAGDSSSAYASPGRQLQGDL
ncbi:MAG TPA: S24/S26 family peptidase [Candidatus Limnocylindrales bacterium]|nr:S24/S26 family peptidase [Candidatus Limnocylindrales bacterium]